MQSNSIEEFTASYSQGSTEAVTTTKIEDLAAILTTGEGEIKVEKEVTMLVKVVKIGILHITTGEGDEGAAVVVAAATTTTTTTTGGGTEAATNPLTMYRITGVVAARVTATGALSRITMTALLVRVLRGMIRRSQRWEMEAILSQAAWVRAAYHMGSKPSMLRDYDASQNCKEWDRHPKGTISWGVFDYMEHARSSLYVLSNGSFIFIKGSCGVTGRNGTG